MYFLTSGCEQKSEEGKKEGETVKEPQVIQCSSRNQIYRLDLYIRIGEHCEDEEGE